jgi:hypothetical protein
MRFVDQLKEKNNGALLLILLFALALRVWGIWNAENNDEINEVIEALRVNSGHFNYERLNKRVYLYILAVEYGIYFVIHWLLGLVASPIAFAEQIVRNMQPLFLIGRFTSTFFGVASVYLVYKLGHRLFSKNVGLLAALLLSVTPVHIEVSQHARVDATLLFFILLSFYYIVLISESQDKKATTQIIVAGLTMGLAFQMKRYAVALFIPLFFAYLATHPWNVFHSIKKFGMDAGMFILSFGAGLVLGDPPILFVFPKFVRSVLGTSKVYTEAINVTSSETIGFVSYPIFLINQMGWPVFIFCLIGIAYAIYRRSRTDMIFLSFIVVLYLLLGSSRYMVSVHYMLPALPFLYLLGWRAAEEGIAAVARPSQRGKRAALVAFSSLLLLIPLLNVFRYELSITGKNTRYLAKEWIEQNIPVGSKILMDSGKSINSFAPPIAENETSIQRVLLRAEENISQGVIVHGMVDEPALVYYKLLMNTVPEKSYDITSTGFGLNVEDLSYYLQNGFEYLIIDRGIAGMYLEEDGAQRHPQSARFYDSVFRSSRLELIKTISPSSLHGGGTFFIFKVKR